MCWGHGGPTAKSRCVRACPGHGVRAPACCAQVQYLEPLLPIHMEASAKSKPCPFHTHTHSLRQGAHSTMQHSACCPQVQYLERLLPTHMEASARQSQAPLVMGQIGISCTPPPQMLTTSLRIVHSLVKARAPHLLLNVHFQVRACLYVCMCACVYVCVLVNICHPCTCPSPPAECALPGERCYISAAVFCFVSCVCFKPGSQAHARKATSDDIK